MGHNSITSNITKEDIIAEIRLTLSADFERKKCIVVVEGEDDYLFFNGKLDSDTEVKESFSGKIGVQEIVDSCSDYRVIGIRDHDFDTLSSSSQMLYYDYNCLEMMLISQDPAFYQFCCAYYIGAVKPLDVRLQLLDGLKWLSFYRKLNSDNGWGINFQGISISRAFDPNSKTIQITNLTDQIKRTNPNKVSDISNQLIAVTNASNTPCDLDGYLCITQGHDFLFHFQTLCEAVRPYKSKSPGAAELFRALVCSYNKEDFSNSALYQTLTDYQNQHNLRILAT
jgi:hypothetical protein